MLQAAPTGPCQASETPKTASTSPQSQQRSPFSLCKASDLTSYKRPAKCNTLLADLAKISPCLEGSSSSNLDLKALQPLQPHTLKMKPSALAQANTANGDGFHKIEITINSTRSLLIPADVASHLLPSALELATDPGRWLHAGKPTYLRASAQAVSRLMHSTMSLQSSTCFTSLDLKHLNLKGC